MAGITLSTADKILKVLYLGPIRELLNNSTVLLSRLEKDSSTQTVSGKTFTIPLHKSRNEAAGVGRAEGGTLPTAGQQGYAEAIVPNKYIYSKIKVTGPVIAATKNSAQAFVDAVTSEMKGVVSDTRRAFNRQLNGDGLDALAHYLTGTGTSSGTLDDGLGNAFSHLPAGVGITVDLLDASAAYAVLDSATVITRGAVTGSAFAYTDTGTIDASASAGDPYVVSGTKGYQVMGIDGIIDDGDPVLLSGGLHGRTVSANPEWVAQIAGTSYSSPQAISFQLIQQALSELATNSDFTEADLKLWLMNYPVRNKFVQLCTDERAFFNVMKIDGGFEAVEYNGKPFVPDPQAKRETMFGIVPETMKIYRSGDFDWMDKDGAVLSRVSGEDAYEATLFHYGDLGCSLRNGNIKLKGIIE